MFLENRKAPARVLALLLGVGLAACAQSSKNPLAPAPGSLQVSVSGLPGTVGARITVTGPGNFSRNLAGTSLISGLTPGTYSISALFVPDGSQAYYATVTPASVAVFSGSTASVGVSYASGPAPTLNLAVAGVQLFQSVQRPDNSVPMVAGRDALLRVFVTASNANSATPAVRVRLYSGSSLVDSVLVPAPGGSVPLGVDTTTIGSSWNALIPASRVQANLAILADVDPSNAVPETDKSDNSWPASGVPAPIQVLPVAPLHLRFVPVRQGGLTGNVTSANQEQLLALTRSMYPLAAYDIDVRATYTSSSGPLVSNDSNGAWGAILSEVYALRTADASTRNYFGVVGTSYNSGYAGLGYIGAPAAIGWDKANTVANVVTHELGHNFGRSHAPCGVTPADASYPYPNAIIGEWGLDLGALALKSPSGFKDIMSYCGPNWVSDYTYEGILNFRGAGPLIASASTASPAGLGLLVWGRIRRDSVILEPAFLVRAPARLPANGGRHRITGTAANGATLFDFSFDGDVAPDLPNGPEEHFTFVVPLDSAVASGLAEITLRAAGRTMSRRDIGLPPATPASLAVSRLGAEEAEVRWDPRYPMALIRDAESGAILSFGRGGGVRLATRAARLSVELSEGVRSRGSVAVPLR
jgi:hypothetical protein